MDEMLVSGVAHARSGSGPPRGVSGPGDDSFGRRGDRRLEVGGDGGEAALYRIDITGYNERRIITPSQASDPAWSPLRR